MLAVTKWLFLFFYAVAGQGDVRFTQRTENAQGKWPQSTVPSLLIRVSLVLRSESARFDRIRNGAGKRSVRGANERQLPEWRAGGVLQDAGTRLVRWLLQQSDYLDYYTTSIVNINSLQGVYQLTNNARIIQMPQTQLRQLADEPFEYSETPRSNEPEWDQLVKFAMRKVLW